MKMKKDKYSGYWLIKGTKNFIKVIGKSTFPRWRVVKRICLGIKGYYYNCPESTETVDFLRIYCEKVTEDTFKEMVKQ